MSATSAALFGHAPLTAAELERAVETLLRGAALDYDALRDHAQQMDGAPDGHENHAMTRR